MTTAQREKRKGCDGREEKGLSVASFEKSSVFTNLIAEIQTCPAAPDPARAAILGLPASGALELGIARQMLLDRHCLELDRPTCSNHREGSR